MQRRHFLHGCLAATTATAAGTAMAAEPPLHEPVHRVAAATMSPSTASAHPLDTALQIARDALQMSREKIDCYEALLVKRETVDGSLGPHEYMTIKVRNRKVADNQLVVPFSVYLGFLKPAAVKGRECLYVENVNNGYVTAHEGGFKGRFLPTVSVDPTGMLAMRGQRYPITEIGLENLLLKLLERGSKARANPSVQCEFRKNARVRDRVCTVIQVTQPTRAPGNEFHTAQIFLDDELGLPIRYAAFDYPRGTNAQGEVIEEYTYLNLKTNVGLTAEDFSRDNAAYKFN